MPSIYTLAGHGCVSAKLRLCRPARYFVLSYRKLLCGRPESGGAEFSARAANPANPFPGQVTELAALMKKHGKCIFLPFADTRGFPNMRVKAGRGRMIPYSGIATFRAPFDCRSGVGENATV